MKIAITSTGEGIQSKVDRSFGRAKWFVTFDTETKTVEAHSNDQNIHASHGAGIQAAQNVAHLGVEALLTGNVGPNAFRTLQAASIEIFLLDATVETVEDALARWEAGDLPGIGAPTREGHWV